MSAGEGLAALETRLRHDLEMIDPGNRNWVHPREHASGAHVYDAVIVGGGQSGLGAAFGLNRNGVRNILVLDENPAGQEGPWETYARMVTLRTPKHITSIDFGVPALTFRAYWEAQHGAAGWEALDKIPRQDWMAYLRWYRRVLDLPVRNDVCVRAIGRDGELFKLNTSGGELLARKVVLATGIQGGGEWHVPPFIKDALPEHLYAHTSQAIDFEALKGKRIAILGAGASAFDNAQHALGCGAAAVEVFVRRRELPRVNPIRHMERAGFIDHFAGLDDATKYAAIASFIRRAMPPTTDTFSRAAAYSGFALHLGTPWDGVRRDGDGVIISTNKGEFAFDFLIVSTGLITDVALRPELAAFAADIALWRDRYQPPEGVALSEIDGHPYLGPGFEFTGRTQEGAKRLHGLFNFNYAALVSLGLSAAALSGLKIALPKLAAAVSTQLFLDDQERLLQAYLDYDEPEFSGQWPLS